MNIKLSDRLNRLPPYLFGKINALKLKLRQEGKDIIDLGMGNPDNGSPADIVKKTAQVLQDKKTHRYSRSRGIPQLLKEFANTYSKKYGVNLNPETETIATIGSKEGLSHLALALLGPGDSVLVPAPSFPIHIWSPIIAGANVITIPLNLIVEQRIEDLARTFEMLWPKPKVLLLNFPHNPTATVATPELFKELVAFARKRELILINDFAYADINFDGYRAPSLLEVEGAKEIAVEFSTMSKSYSMAGWRVGFCAGNERMVNALAKIKGYYDYGIFTPIQVGAIMALRHHWKTAPTHYSAIYQKRRNILVEGLNASGWDIAKPKATMFVWASIPSEFQKVGSMRFTRFLLEEAEVCVSPGIGFGKEGEGFIRISLVENDKRIRQAVRQIKHTLQNTSADTLIQKYPEEL